MCRLLNSKSWPLFILSFSHFEADQTHRVRSWLPGSYQPDRLGALPSTAGHLERDWLLLPAEGVECSEPEGGQRMSFLCHKGSGLCSASLSDPHLRLTAGYQMAFDARKLAGWSQEGEKPGQRVGVILLPAPGQDRTGKTVGLHPRGLG